MEPEPVLSRDARTGETRARVGVEADPRAVDAAVRAADATRDALADMLETASRRLRKINLTSGQERTGATEEVVQRAKAAVASLTARLATHRRC